MTVRNYEHYEQLPPDELTAAQLESMRSGLRDGAYPGYPAQVDRLVLDPQEVEYDLEGRVILPDGPWTVNPTGAARFAPVPTAEEQAEYAARGLELDSMGRPLHPWFWRMVSDAAIGAVLGTANYYYRAENYTADGVYLHDDCVLLQRRGDTGTWALPGGYRDPGEDSLTATLREGTEETGVTPGPDARIRMVYEGPVADIRATAHAWPETAAYLIDLGYGGEHPPVVVSDESSDVAWVPLSLLEEQDVQLFGSHRFLIEQAVRNREVDLNTDYWTAQFAEAPIAAKTGLVRMRPAVPGEVIRTVLADGTEETVNTAKEDQVVITAASGEEYLVGTEKAASRYEATDVPGVYRAKGKIRVIDNPTERPIIVMAPWGERQYGAADCKLAVIYDPEHPDQVGADRYIIGAAEYAQTYGLVAPETNA